MQFVTAGLIGLLRLYQRTLSRLLPGVCRFQPSCSQYAVEALQRHGLWHGGGLALRRLVHCHPFHPGGYDPVPPAEPHPRPPPGHADVPLAGEGEAEQHRREASATEGQARY